MKSKRVLELLVVVITILLSGCQSSGLLQTREGYSPEDFYSLIDVAPYPTDCFVGISGPYSSQERMVKEAIISCARQVALNEIIEIDSRIVTQWDSKRGLLSFATEEKAYYDEKTLAPIIERLEILSIDFDTKAGAVVVAQDPLKTGIERPEIKGLDKKGKPLWISTFPKHEAYYFGVGTSGPYRFLNDSLEAADFTAAQDLLNKYPDFLFAKSYVNVQEGSGVILMESGTYQDARGILRGFMVVSRYYDELTKSFWSLVAVPK